MRPGLPQRLSEFLSYLPLRIATVNKRDFKSYFIYRVSQKKRNTLRKNCALFINSLRFIVYKFFANEYANSSDFLGRPSTAKYVSFQLNLKTISFIIKFNNIVSPNFELHCLENSYIKHITLYAVSKLMPFYLQQVKLLHTKASLCMLYTYI